MMKRYEHWCSLDGGGLGQPEEKAAGDWVLYEDAVAAVAAERERCAKLADEYATWGGSNFHGWFTKLAAAIRAKRPHTARG